MYIWRRIATYNPLMGVATKQESLERKLKKAEYRAYLQKVTSLFRLAIHDKYNLRIYLNRREFSEYPSGQGFAIVKILNKQEMVDMVEFDERLSSVRLPILVCFPEEEDEKT